MKKRKSEIKSAMSDPFDFLSGLRGGTSSTDTFNVDNLGKSAHKLIGSAFEEQELNIAKTIREVVDSKILVPRDMKVDDSGIPVAANIVEWCTKERFSMINGERPYIEQIIWGIIAFNEACPRCSDVEYLYHDHKVNDTYAKLEKKVAMLEHGVCPHCGWGRSKLVAKKRMKFIQELAVSAGQRSGKSMSIAGYFAPYLTHRLLKLQNPNAFYGLKTGTMLHCTFVALTYAQAKDTLWQNFYATLTESQWFQEYHSMLAYFGERYGEKLLKFNDTYVAYPSRGLLCYPAGPDKRVLRGRTRYFTSVDEVGWFDSNKDSNKVKDNAHEVVGALDRSLLTVRGAAERLLRAGYDDVYPGYSMNVSSPSHRNDMIMTLVRRSENSDTMYGVIRPTWEVNPTLPRNSSTMIEAFRTDPITAERDYGAMPPLASSPFLQNHTEIADCAKIKRNGITLRRTVIHKKKRGESFTYANVRKLRTGKHPTVMAIDAGLTDNSFSGVVGSVVDGIVKIHVVFDIIPDVGAPLNHTFIFNDVILPIIEKWNVRVLYADRWNSVKLLQDAKDMVPTVEISAQHSLKYKEMFTVKTLIQQGLLYLPKPESESVKDSLDFDAEAYPSCFVDRPMDHLYLQLATVKDTGKMVDKGDGYTDDTFRALALCVWALHEEDVQIALSMADDLPNTNRPTAIAASKLYSGGGGAIGTGSSSGVQLGISSSRR